ncbi:hypothetical protein FIA58_011705 [Flavobacterium jejuense]|uniref:Uncharacterized protein n=1 Tax=Flavobacterium jejuense TaxID=1544455 RepID=A0ABX0IR86_9FLAO|nr:hypothetical protein [Flavobacterium jejuense]NHN26345.1 hypothetical protein [Flavobacterium jejuense]
MKKLVFGLIATVLFSFTASANNTAEVNPVQKEITNYVLDGKSYSPFEFSKLSAETLEDAKACTVTVNVTVNTPSGPQTFTTTETFEASWLGCLAAKVAAFLASIWQPSVN